MSNKYDKALKQLGIVWDDKQFDIVWKDLTKEQKQIIHDLSSDIKKAIRELK